MKKQTLKLTIVFVVLLLFSFLIGSISLNAGKWHKKRTPKNHVKTTMPKTTHKTKPVTSPNITTTQKPKETEGVEKNVSVRNSIDINGTIVNVVLYITNNTKNEVLINYGSSMKADFQLLDENKNTLLTWSANKSFMQMVTDVHILPGETTEFLCSENVNKDILTKIKFVKSFISGKSDDFKINIDGYLLEI